MDGSEAGSGQGGEDPWVGDDGVGDAFAAVQARTDQVIRVALIQPGAGRADRRAPVAATDQHDSIGRGATAVLVVHFARACVGDPGEAFQV
jgi:hypothetical protein